MPGNQVMSTPQMILSILGILVVVFGAYYATYLVAKKSGGGRQGRAMQVVDRMAMSKDKMICLITVGDKVYLVAMTDGGAALLDSFEGEEAEKLRRMGAPMMPAGAGLLQKGINRGVDAVKARLENRRLDKSLEQALEQWGPEKTPPAGRRRKAVTIDDVLSKDELGDAIRQMNRREKRGEDDGQDREHRV